MARKQKLPRMTAVIPIYDVPVWIATNEETMRDWNERMSLGLDEEDFSGYSQAVTVKITVSVEGQNCMGLVFGIYNDNLGVICHEASHGALMIYSNIGGIDPITEQEPYCYLVQFIADLIGSELRK